MKDLIYKFCFFYSFSSFGIVKIWINNILILANKDFVNKKKVAIKFIKITTKNWKHLIFLQSVKFNEAQIKLNLEEIVLTKKSYISNIFLVTNHNRNFISSKKIIKKKLFSKK